MAWEPFSAEAIALDGELRRLHQAGKLSGAIDAIKAALQRAHREGPSNESYEDFERRHQTQGG